MTEYQWRPGGPKPAVDANVFGQTMERLAGTGGDVRAVPPQAVVAEARRRGSPIKALFDWDKDKAAEQHWLSQARHYCNSLQVVRVHVEHGPTLGTKALFNVRVNDERGYVNQSHIRSSDDLTNQVIAQARKDLGVLVEKYAAVVGFGKYVERLQLVIDDMQIELDKLAADAVHRGTKRPRAEAAEEARAD